MGELSPITAFSLGIEEDFPAPSKRGQLNVLIKNDSELIKQFPFRADIGEIKFRLADALVGRGSPGDYERAAAIYEEILKNYGSPYLRARAQIGKAELLTPGIRPENISMALQLCETARKNLKSDISDFFMAKTYIIEADLRLVRDNKKEKDHEKAMKLHEKLIKSRKANWYFRARAHIGKAELILYHFPKKISQAVILCEKAERGLINRPDDYFAIKVKLIKAQLIRRRGRGHDLRKTSQLLEEIIKTNTSYQDLAAQARVALAEISPIDKACKILQQLHEMEGLEPYIKQKIKMLDEELKTKKE
ncbi:hypothetical protein A2526_00610 [candidate division WOR-1 bacterium RIFOXYD2_FULL_36_8]|uniref:Tetratricopeptide repeat protein n=1 Tax=candidate division WOR-1 bacterium RIFOXYB2_FULL_36_35 TaxID=1802578 RepID=A0A1F4S3M1_UNCSA|nr:MAG: hypothetical protein A2230_09070 [candidate division WOR-1 bacterium RIFOXYA2_FULL_36_21]OGC15022.1 MAG: hypothetical protein A2290_01710 [candidate division WOR-1 bacterium RIFOXYB2_FULL_36_35]OGC18729.1 MAG: hypothetical protein A2282_07490 [candidate division WOR-1 bacterium RIFOXYA12_FULL_36_13]OGC37577.1 MAG: hypothetical protein A2526_00610 [candidate division WOR-1 bacterium RIFOXYD2_FULL_36_8]